MAVYTSLEIVFVLADGELIPKPVDGRRVSSIEIRNKAEFEGQIEEGARFSALIKNSKGSSRNPRLTVELERRLVDTNGDQPLGEDFWIDPLQFALIDAQMSDAHHPDSLHLWFVGPQGSGKTTLASVLAAHYDVPFCETDGAAIWHPRAAFGSESAKDGSTVFVRSKLADFLLNTSPSDDGLAGIVLVDEFGRMNEAGEGPWHGLLGPARSFTFTTTEGPMLVRVPNGVIFILADNPAGGGFMNVLPMDRALQDRVIRQEFGYPPAAWERAWLIRKTSIGAKDAGAIVEAINEIRGYAIQSGFELGGPSPRRSLAAARLTCRGIPVVTAVRHLAVGYYSGTEAGSDRSRLETYLKGKRLLQEVVAVIRSDVN